MSLVERYEQVVERIRRIAVDCGRGADDVQLVIASKTQPAESIEALIRHGHRVFGENRVQEAQSKWPALKAAYPDVELHMIGPLQTNKVRDVFALFDVIETVDREHLAAAIAKEKTRTGWCPRLLAEINIGNEPQKAGIPPDDAAAFIQACQAKHSLKIEGLMCIPPANEQASPYFARMQELARDLELGILSMGMTADYPQAIQLGATHVRVGTAIFGARETAG